MNKEIIKPMATKFSEVFAKSMLKKHTRKCCRRGLTHLDANPLFKKKNVQILMGHSVHTIGVHIDYAPDTEKKIRGENWRKQDSLFSG